MVGRWRERLDANTSLGIPAHVTVTYPFVPGRGHQRADQRQRLHPGQFGSVPSFGFVLDHVDWFEAETLWLGAALIRRRCAP